MKTISPNPIFLACWLVLLAPLFSLSDPTDVLDIGSRRELFVDRLPIDTMAGTELRLHAPIPAGKVLEFNEPWEGRYVGYITVFADGGLFRMYYRGLPVSGADGSDNEQTCYAESRDGVRWEKPNVAVYDMDGVPNNIVLKQMTPFSHNFSPFLDTRPGIPSSERYKALAGIFETGLFGFVSSDGLHWKKILEEPLIVKGIFDSQNLAFWSESENCYVCYFRTWSKGEFEGYRTVSRCTSPDFIHWNEPVKMTFGDTPEEHLYTSQTHPYFRAPHMYIAYPARFMPGRRILQKEDFEKIGGEAGYSGDCSDTCFMSSRGGDRFDRTFMEGFIRPGLGLNNWSSRTNYTACGTIPTGEGEMSLFVQRNYGQLSHYLERLTLRTDGFVSLHAPYAGGEAVTKPLRFLGNRLLINYSTSAAGSVWIELQDESGKPIDGFSKNDCDEIIGDRIDRAVTWKDRFDVSSLTGKTIRLHFILKDADVYSFQFQSSSPNE